MLLKRGLHANKDPSDIYRTIEDIEKFFKDLPSSGVGRESASTLSAVSAAHRIYTNSLATMPWMVRQKVGDMRHEPDHYLEPILKVHMCEGMTPYRVQKAIASDAFWYGAGFAYPRRDATGHVVEIIPLPSRGHTRYFDETTGVIWYAFSVESDRPKKQILTRKFMASELLIHFFESYDGYTGVGLLDMARQVINTDLSAQEYAQKFYTNGARPSGIVEVSTAASSETRKTIREDFERMASGLDNAFRAVVLDLGMKYTPLGISQKDSQYLESRAFTVEEVSRFTGIPGYMLQTGKQSYESNEQHQIDFVTNTLNAPVTQIEQEWTMKLLLPRERESGLYLKRNLTSLLRGDSAARAAYHEKMIGLGIENQDEARALEDKSPLPNGRGSHYWMSKNYDTIENIMSGGDTNG